MKALIILCALIPFTSQAGLERLSLVNLSMDYVAPEGKATADKVSIGISLHDEPQEFSILRTEDSFEINSAALDFTWLNPPEFFMKLEKIQTSDLRVSLGGKIHTIEGKKLIAKPEKQGDYVASGIRASCSGDSTTGELEDRLIHDCVKSTNLTINKIDVPTDFFLYKIITNLPPVSPEIDTPGDNVVLKIDDGKTYFQVYIKYIIRAGLRFYGHVQLEDNENVIAIRVDEVKFGYFPVTRLVMDKLKDTIQSESVKVDPPWIRITR